MSSPLLVNEILAAERTADLRRAATQHRRAAAVRPAPSGEPVRRRRFRRTRPAGATT